MTATVIDLHDRMEGAAARTRQIRGYVQLLAYVAIGAVVLALVALVLMAGSVRT